MQSVRLCFRVLDLRRPIQHRSCIQQQQQRQLRPQKLFSQHPLVQVHDPFQSIRNVLWPHYNCKNKRHTHLLKTLLMLTLMGA